MPPPPGPSPEPVPPAVPAWWDELEATLAAHRPPEGEARPLARSGVACVLALRPLPRVLLMRRAENASDPWSGHVSLPGGRHEPTDRDLAHTAIRETREEVGVDLAHAARLVGRLEPRRAVGRGRVLSLEVTPYVFVLERDVSPEPGVEAQEVFWLPLDEAAAGRLDGEVRRRRAAGLMRMPCWRYEGRVVWGLTYGILRRLLELAGAVDER